jgi:hypothetical protein
MIELSPSSPMSAQRGPTAPIALVGQPPTRREAVELLERCLQLSDDAALSTLRQGGLPLGITGRALLGLMRAGTLGVGVVADLLLNAQPANGALESAWLSNRQLNRDLQALLHSAADVPQFLQSQLLVAPQALRPELDRLRLAFVNDMLAARNVSAQEREAYWQRAQRYLTTFFLLRLNPLPGDVDMPTFETMRAVVEGYGRYLQSLPRPGVVPPPSQPAPPATAGPGVAPQVAAAGQQPTEISTGSPRVSALYYPPQGYGLGELQSA